MKRLGYILSVGGVVVPTAYVIYMLAIEGYGTAALIIAFGVIYVAGYWQRLCDTWTREYSRRSHVSESPYWKALMLAKALVWFIHPIQVIEWTLGKKHYVRQRESQYDSERVSRPLT